MSTDTGRSVTGAGIPAHAFVGPVTDTPTVATSASQSGGVADTGAFELVGSSGNPLLTTGPVNGITLGAETAATDPLYDATDPTTGGGDTGSVLISPFIRPGSVSNVFYNHYSWLRTMEDLFSVGKASPGLDGLGHLGYTPPRIRPWRRSAPTCSTTPRVPPPRPGPRPFRCRRRSVGWRSVAWPPSAACASAAHPDSRH